MSSHVNPAHSRAVWHPGLLSWLLCFLPVSPGSSLSVRGVMVTAGTVAWCVIHVCFLVQEDAVPL